MSVVERFKIQRDAAQNLSRYEWFVNKNMDTRQEAQCSDEVVGSRGSLCLVVVVLGEGFAKSQDEKKMDVRKICRCNMTARVRVEFVQISHERLFVK